MPLQLTHKHSLLMLCLILPALLLLRTQFNVTSGHMDEYDYLFVGKTLLAGGDWPSHSYIFGWDLNWLLLAWGDTAFGGLHGARMVAATLGLISMAGMYAFVYTLWRNHLIAQLATIMLGFEGAHLYTSALATYDIISFTVFTCALPFVLLTCQATSKKLLWTVFSCTLLSSAVMSKYVAIIYLPFIALFVLWHAPRYALIGMLFLTTILSTYTVINYDQLKILYEVQIQSTHGTNTSFSGILNRTGRQLWVILLLAGFSLIYCVLVRHKEINKVLLLLVFSLPLVLYHLASQNVISLQKHLMFSSLFLIPIIAWWLHEFYLQGKQSHIHAVVVVTCLSAYGLINLDKLNIMQSSYPNVREISSIAKQIDPSDSVLSEDPYLFRYLLLDTLAQKQISETTWLDNNRDGKYERLDVRQAIWDRKFDYVFLNDQQHKKFNVILRKMLFLRSYELIFEKNYQLETMSGQARHGAISMFRKKTET